MTENNLTLSLVANFDDLVRRLAPYNTELTDFTIEMVKIIDQLNDQFNYAAKEVKMFKDRCHFLEMENRRLDANLKNIKASYQKEVEFRASICRGNPRNDEITFSSDCLTENDFDKSEDDLDEPTRKQRGEIKFASNKNLIVDTPMEEPTKTLPEPKFVSNPTLTPISENISRTALLNSQSKSRIDTRSHSLVQKKLLKTNVTCSVCDARFGFYSNYLLCNDCRAVCHVNCKPKLALPCVPYATSNQVGKKGRLITIADYVSPISRPCIPSIIIHCCKEIERRGLNEFGPYRVPGSDAVVKDMVDRFIKGKGGVPNLTNLDINVVCSMIKNFLGRLDESLITRVLWKDFAEAVKAESIDDRIPFIVTAINDLPMANRHTLAYLMLHLHRIAASPACKMPCSNLAKIFGPTIIGFSSPNTAITAAIYTENAIQIKIMETLFIIPSDFWAELISDPSEFMQQQQPSTTEKVNKRQSIGSRVVGGSLQSQVLNPWTVNRRQKKRTLF